MFLWQWGISEDLLVSETVLPDCRAVISIHKNRLIVIRNIPLIKKGCLFGI